LPELLGYHLRRAQLRVFHAFAEAMRPLDLTPGQYGALELVAANPGLNQTTLGVALGVDRSTVVALVDRLQGRGLVARRPLAADRRVRALHLTELGEASLADARARVAVHDAALTPGLTPAERALLLRLLARVVPATPDIGP
jgi:DNA-binding MarR family transcriptional regulator